MRCALVLVCLLPLACAKEAPKPVARGPRAGLHEPRVPAWFKSQAARNEIAEPTEAASLPASDEAGPAAQPASTAAAAPAGPDVFDSPSAGLRIRKPHGWRFVSLDEVQRTRDAARAADPVLRAGLRYAPLPLVSITRDPAGRAGFSPSIVVAARALPEAPLAPVELMQALLPSLTLGLTGATASQPPAAIRLAGQPGAEARVRHTVNGTPVESRIVAVRRGAALLVFTLTGGLKGPDRCEQELAEALRSVELR
jgi:hypothetical protein